MVYVGMVGVMCVVDCEVNKWVYLLLCDWIIILFVFDECGYIVGVFDLFWSDVDVLVVLEEMVVVDFVVGLVLLVWGGWD